MEYRKLNFLISWDLRRVFHAPVSLSCLSLLNSCPASDTSPHIRPFLVLFPCFPIAAGAHARAHVYTRVSGRIERRVTRFESPVQHRSSWRRRETGNVDSAMRTKARDEGTKIAKRDREKWERGEGWNTSARRSKNSPLLLLILLSFSLHSLLSILAESRLRTLCRKRRDESEDEVQEIYAWMIIARSIRGSIDPSG